MVVLDLKNLAAEARANSTGELRSAQAAGVSIYGADESGHVFEYSADGHTFAVELHGDDLTRIREVA